MIFNRNYNFSSSKKISTIKQNLLGKHLQLHSLDFEILEKEGNLKIIPHAENTERMLTLPIANIFFKEKNSKTYVNIETHPRRIDVGGPYILMAMCFAIFMAGFLMSLYGGVDQSSTSKIMMAIGLAVFAIFWVRMELGYFDYVRKIKNWIKQQA